MSRPRILIPVPTSFDDEYNAKSWPEYACAIAEAGGEPVRLPLTHTPQDLETLASEAAGFLLPGSGADIDPAHYGHDRNAASAPPDPLREATDRALLEAAEIAGTPLLGICLGLQSLNVFYGGTLHQDLNPMPVNHRAGRSVQVAHAACVARDSLLSFSLDGTAEPVPDDASFSRLQVNSSHHQAVAIPGDTLRVVAHCPADGIIEAVEGSRADRWLLGVQWHPERTTQSSAASRALFSSFLRACSVSCQP